jgi:hypothetical protein
MMNFCLSLDFDRWRGHSMPQYEARSLDA